MNRNQVVETFELLGSISSDFLAAWSSGFVDIEADLILVDDLASIIAPFVPAAAEAKQVIELLEILLPAMKKLHISPGVGQNIGPLPPGPFGHVGR